MKTPTKYSFLKTSIAAAIALASVPTFADFSDANTDYTLAPQNYHVWNEALNPVDLVNNILCFTGQLKFNEFINKGPYLALADEGACFENEGGDSQSAQSSGAANTPSYTKIVVNATRESVEDPLLVSVWIPGMGGGDDAQSIKFKAAITEGVSEENPFGHFTFNYNFFESIDSTTAMGGGEIKTVDIPGKIGFTFYELEAGEFSFSKSASVVMNNDRSEGIAFTSHSQMMNGEEEGAAYGLAFNSNNVLVQKSDSYANLPFATQNPNTGEEFCLSRTEFNESVWRYNLFDAATGDSIELNSGLPFRYDSDNNDTAESYGHVGYWGLWAEHPEALENGDTIFVDHHENNSQTTTEYTIVKAPGRLIKHTVQELTLAQASGVQFFYWSLDAQQAGFQNWIVEYLTTDDGVETNGFYKVAGGSHDENGPMSTDLPEPVAVILNEHETLNMHSEQLGGPVKYKNGDNFITFAKQEFINGSETGEGELLADGNITLYCVDRCPVGTLNSDQLSNWNSPYSDPLSSVDDAIAFTFSTSGPNPFTLIRDSNSEPIRYADDLTREALEANQSPFSWGFRSGSLVTADVLATLSSPWDVYNPAKVTVYYEWETGLNSFNQMISIQDEEGSILTFDKPIQFTYTHTDANDRSGDAGMFDGKVVLLNYGGNGNLGGIPSTRDNQGRHRSLFTIADGTLMGADNRYVIKAQEIEGTMKMTPGQCSTLELAEPAAPVPTGTTDSAADIGDMPIVTDAPSVIAGIIQTTEP